MRPAAASTLRRSIMLMAAGILAMPAASRAHDFWIQPSSFSVSPASLVKVALRVGHVFAGDPVVRDPEHFKRFVIAGPDGLRPILGQDGLDPAGLLRPEVQGMHVVGYQSQPTPHVMEGPGFERYLDEEGLETISELRALRGQSNLAGREIFSRSAKALVAVGDDASAGHDRRLGLPLELLPEVSPVHLPQGAPLPVRLLYLGLPLRGVLVTATNQYAPDSPVSLRTDSEGRVRFAADKPGMWLIKAVHMVPAPPGVNADWESFWASLTFAIIRQ